MGEFTQFTTIRVGTPLPQDHPHFGTQADAARLAVVPVTLKSPRGGNDRPHPFGANGTHPQACVRCGNRPDAAVHVIPPRADSIDWTGIFARH